MKPVLVKVIINQMTSFKFKIQHRIEEMNHSLKNKLSSLDYTQLHALAN